MTGREPARPVIKERLAALTPSQRAALEQLKAVKRAYDDAPDAYARQILRCVREGITYGMMSHELGVGRVTIFQVCRRFKDRIVDDL